VTKKIDIPKEKLIELYIKQKLSTHEIGRIIGCDPTVVQNRLREQKIKLRNPKKKIIVSKERLNNLYIRRRLSTQKISKLLKISSCSVYYKLKEVNIKTRKKILFDINKIKLEELYTKNKLSCSEISKIYKFDTVTVFNKLKKYSIKTRSYLEANIKYPKKVFNGNSKLKAYMIGFRLGDLNVKSLNNKSTVIVKSSTTKKDQFNLIKKVYGGYGHFWFKKYGEVFNIMTFLDNSFNFLVKKEDNIEDWILEDKNNFLAFLAGYADAEGNFGVYQNRARFRLGTYDRGILLQIQKELINMGITTKFRLEEEAGNRNNNKNFYRISINERNSLLKFICAIKSYIKHIKRKNDLLKCENNLLERNKRHEQRVLS
jgi:hypothetical protein